MHDCYKNDLKTTKNNDIWCQEQPPSCKKTTATSKRSCKRMFWQGARIDGKKKSINQSNKLKIQVCIPDCLQFQNQVWTALQDGNPIYLYKWSPLTAVITNSLHCGWSTSSKKIAAVGWNLNGMISMHMLSWWEHPSITHEKPIWQPNNPTFCLPQAVRSPSPRRCGAAWFPFPCAPSPPPAQLPSSLPHSLPVRRFPYLASSTPGSSSLP